MTPPLLPAQFQNHGPVPVIADAAPVLQRPVVGALETVVPFADPHAPFTGGGPDEHVAVAPPLIPRHDHPNCPFPLAATCVAVPAEHNPVVGCVVEVDPFAGPHAPAVPATGALQSINVPTPVPSHTQLHGPLPPTADAVPVAQRPLVGALLAATPFAGPHCPLLPDATGAAHDAFVPPFAPAQVQFQGPLPDTADAVPALHRPLAGAALVTIPFAGPHAPFTDTAGAEHAAFVPPPAPLQVQLHGPAPLTAVAVPVLHSPPDGAVAAGTPFAGPHAPFATSGAEQDAAVPPSMPRQLHVHGPLPLRFAAVPAEQSPLKGAVPVPTPFAGPHAPFVAGGLAEQVAVVPPYAPAQVHTHGPVPATADAVPAMHRFAVGVAVVVLPFALPHCPFSGPGCASQITLVPSFAPRHDHAHGPVPDTADAVPPLHRPVVGFAACAVFAAGPHAPFTGDPAATGASHDAFVPPSNPAQLHVHGPLPETAEAAPVLHRLTVGAAVTATPLAAPHTPFTGVSSTAAEHDTVLPPFVPAQLQPQMERG